MLKFVEGINLMIGNVVEIETIPVTGTCKNGKKCKYADVNKNAGNRYFLTEFVIDRSLDYGMDPEENHPDFNFDYYKTKKVSFYDEIKKKLVFDTKNDSNDIKKIYSYPSLSLSHVVHKEDNNCIASFRYVSGYNVVDYGTGNEINHKYYTSELDKGFV